MIRAKTVNVAEAKARLSELVPRAARGEEIVIARNGEPQAIVTSNDTFRSYEVDVIDARL